MAAADIRELAKNNEQYEAQFPHNIKFSEFQNNKAILILACVDARSNPYEFWNLPFGPGILRNAGGRATEDALRSMRVLSTIMANGTSTLGAVAVVHHTDCGLFHGPNSAIASLGTSWPRELVTTLSLLLSLRRWTSAASPKHDSVEASVKEYMAVIKAGPYLPKDLEVLGYVHETSTGKTREVS